MAKRQTILDLLDEQEPAVRNAFLRAIQNMRDDADLTRLRQALEAGDIAAAVAALNLDRAQIEPLRRALGAAYLEAGDWSVDRIRRAARSAGVTLTGYFDGRNMRAENFLATQSSRLIVEITDETRRIARDYLTRVMREGLNANTAALDLVGRVSRETGRRAGGIMGLSSDLVVHVENAQRQLRSGDPAEMSRYFDRSARDRRFDPTVRRAIREGKPVSASDARKITGRYADRLLRYRGDRIARTELLGSLHEAQDEGLRQMIDGGKLREDQITRVWDAQEDSDTRDSHRLMEAQARGVNQPFETGAGYRLMYPGDRSLGAPASEIIQCRCVVRQRIDFLKGLEGE